MKGLSPTQRTLRQLRQEGTIAGIVERFIHQAGAFGLRSDLFGFIDLIAMSPDRGIIGIQCCARSGHAAHRRKILQDCSYLATEWLKSGGKIEIWSWGLQKVKRGGIAKKWTPKVEKITLDSFERAE